MSYLAAATLGLVALARPISGHDLEGILWLALSIVFFVLGALGDIKGKGP